jgi:hypothetical protein
VRPVVSEARINRLWEATSGRLERAAWGRRWKWGGTIAGALALAAMAVVFVHTRHGEAPTQSLWEGAALETAGDALSMALVDGSRLRLGSSSRVEVEKGDASAVKLVLRRGRVECDVTHQPGRTFIVAADGVEVHVVGTHFSVAMDPNGNFTRVEVHVDRGVVEVTNAEHPEDRTEVRAGEGWSEIVHPPPAASAVNTAPAPETVEAPPIEVAPAPAEPRVAAPSAAREPRTAGPRELLETANELRREGRVREAAQAYESLLNRYPNDGRAGLSAFELGRLRMDRLSDMAGAVPALERAALLAPGASFREDAMARLVTAYARTGNMAGCERARDHYLESYATGIHRQSVVAACSAR